LFKNRLDYFLRQQLLSILQWITVHKFDTDLKIINYFKYEWTAINLWNSNYHLKDWKYGKLISDQINQSAFTIFQFPE
jgi:hypothetical protein